ncbi:hypothetical protein EVAR_64917_1 [Eumeta japonica]|uniref:Uncharacterized protein n=1 Tax=Eumeta variegata TaxID=151549 RepID=A0A4C1ZN29_EUMVA|nr:hypothetical protein EVAR_64917_1 [Eumeta japonica]
MQHWSSKLTAKHSAFSEPLTARELSGFLKGGVGRHPSDFRALVSFQKIQCEGVMSSMRLLHSSSMTDALNRLQFIDGASACTYELYTLHTRGRGDAFQKFSVGAPYALGTPIRGRTIQTAPALGLLLVSPSRHTI